MKVRDGKMKDKIIEVLNRKNKALDVLEIFRLLELNRNQYDELVANITMMSNDYTIYKTNKGRYMTFEKSPLKKGKLIVNKKGFGFVDLVDEDDIYVDKKNLNGAIHNDTVICEVLGKFKGKTEGRIVKVIDRKLDYLVGEFYLENNLGHLILDDDKLKITINIKKEDINKAVDGHKVLVKIKESLGNNIYYAEVVKVLGHKNDPGVDILSIVYKYEIPDTFSKEVFDELKNIPDHVLAKDKENRKDLTKDVIFTIDGDDTKDIDDAISIKKLDNGNYLLGVHIADVSYYVKDGTYLDINAMNRGCSCYLVDRVIPMIPHQLSNGICSLNEGVERLAVSCIMEIDNKGNTLKYDVFPSIIKSRKKMTYKNVNKILDNESCPSGYEEFKDDLLLMYELSTIVRKNKLDRGYLDFDIDEAKIIVDENCHPIDIKKRERGKGENLIEDFMILANESVASLINNMDLPFIYRVHEVPDEDKIREFVSYLSSLGYVYKGNLRDITPKTVQDLLEFVKDKKESYMLSSLLLRSMRKAVYKDINLGHFGLASKCYTHFTSPIRRYPDTTVHRLLHTYLFEHKLSNEVVNYWENKLPMIAMVSSECERRAIDCEREVDDMKKAEYMEEHIGEVYSGLISGITNFGIFIMLDNLVEGLTRFEDMKEYFKYDEKNMAAIGEKSKTKYTIGSKVNVKVIRASKEDKQIDFEILGSV